MEAIEHILVGCTYSWITWHEVLSWICSTVSIPTAGVNFVDWWYAITRASSTAARKGASLAIMLTAWWLWKRRHVLIFDDMPA
jgi:hypothetical protein